MDWLDNMNKAIEYIESNLTDEISYERASRIACCSVFHFQRMFSYIAGVSLSEYIRRRKMTLAAFDLQSTEELVIDLSLKYGYESPTAFNRAFQGIHGISPSKARKAGSDLKAYPKISLRFLSKEKNR
jgi:AraC family transcriptional regulator